MWHVTSASIIWGTRRCSKEASARGWCPRELHGSAPSLGNLRGAQSATLRRGHWG